jgi:hypothetical protein
MLRGRLSTVAALAAGLAGCADGPEPLERFDIRLALDVGSESATCAASCAEYPLRCDVKVGVRILDLPTDVSVQPAERVAPECIRPRGLVGNVCDLGSGALQVKLLDVPRERLQIEVAVWRDESPEAPEPTCPRVIYDLQGRPMAAGGGPEPAYARRVFFDFGGSGGGVAVVPLACNEPDLLDDASCQPLKTYVRVEMDDLDSLLLGVEQGLAARLDVRVGRPVPEGGGFSIEPSSTYEMDRALTPPEVRPFFENTISGRPFAPGDDICVVVSDVVVASPSAVTCTAAADDEPDANRQVNLELQGYLIKKPDLDSVLHALGLAEFPRDGLVLGRVIDEQTSLPLAGVTLQPRGGLQHVTYLDPDLNVMAELATTSSSGYFAATEVPFDTVWEASRPDGYRNVGTARGGQIRDRVTVLIIPMRQPLSAQPQSALH